MIKIKQNQKPIEYDIHLKYLCNQCGQIHWLSFQESSTKHFKIVCDCGNIFGVRRTKSIKITYIKPKTKVSKKNVQEIPIDILDEAAKILVTYGFTLNEAKQLLQSSYSSNPILDIPSLIKQSLESLKT